MAAYSALGFIGLGVMGEGMCSNLARKADAPVHGFDLDPEKIVRLAADGLLPATSIQDLAQKVEVIFLSLPGGPQVRAVCDQILAVKGAVRLIVDMSTTPVSVARELAQESAACGVEFIDAPVARLRRAAREGTLSIMVGGTKEQFERVSPYLRYMGTDITHCGAVGAGQVVKILNNMVVFMNVHALAEALTVGRAHGVDGKTLFEVFRLGSADSFMLRSAGLNSLAPDVFPLDAFPTTYARKDIGYAQDLAKEKEFTLPGANATTALLDAALTAGFEHDYYPIFIKLLDGRAGKKQ